MHEMARWSVAPYFHVGNVVATADYYRDMLGFAYDRFWGEPPSFCMVYRRGVVLMLSQQSGQSAVRPNHTVGSDGEEWDAYIWIDDADALLSEYRSRGVQVVRDICDQEYGCRDFEVEDCNGYRLCFGHTLA